MEEKESHKAKEEYYKMLFEKTQRELDQELEKKVGKGAVGEGYDGKSDAINENVGRNTVTFVVPNPSPVKVL